MSTGGQRRVTGDKTQETAALLRLGSDCDFPPEEIWGNLGICKVSPCACADATVWIAALWGVKHGEPQAMDLVMTPAPNTEVPAGFSHQQSSGNGGAQI